MTYVVTGLAHPIAIVGDSLFAGSMGGGNVSYRDALQNNLEKILTLPDETIICPGHGPMTTVGEEKQTQPVFCGTQLMFDFRCSMDDVASARWTNSELQSRTKQFALRVFKLVDALPRTRGWSRDLQISSCERYVCWRKLSQRMSRAITSRICSQAGKLR